MTEKELQDICCSICGCANVDYMHIPNESGTANRRALGMRKGVPDLILIDNNIMFVELKRSENIKPSDAQENFLLSLKKHGVMSKVVGSERQFHTAIKRVKKERSTASVGVPLNFSALYSDIMSAEERVHKFFMEKQGMYNPNELFAIKLFNHQNSKFPWLCNIKDKYFVSTKPSYITSKILMAGWDVIYI